MKWSDFTVTVHWAVVEQHLKRTGYRSVLSSIWLMLLQCDGPENFCRHSLVFVMCKPTLTQVIFVWTERGNGVIMLTYFFFFFLIKCVFSVIDDSNEKSFWNSDFIIWSFLWFHITIPFSYSFVMELSYLAVLCTGFYLFTDHTPNYIRGSV